MGEIIRIPLEEELKESYLDYAMSVIVGRALPDVRDGLKPVQRRILYAMYEMGNHWNKPFKKCARIVGEVIGKYHPHGDMPVYEALVRMAQDFTMRYPLVDGQGNFGSVDGDAPAAMRYTEARLSKIAHKLLENIEEDTVEFVPNYDNTLKEPVVLPSKIPNLLINGGSGIAVGMATNIPPHNLTEVVDALLLLLEKPEASIEEILQIIKGPDFPTGASIVGKEGIKEAYTTGKGLIKIRATYFIEEEKGKKRIVFNEIPYQTSKAKIVEKIAYLIKEKKIEGISEVRDESDREGIRIVVEVKKEWHSMIKNIINSLYKLTPLESSFGIIFLVLVNGKPEVLNIKSLLWHFLKWRETVILRRTSYRLKRAEHRIHILEGFLKALDHIDEIIELIKNSKTPAEAKERLMKTFEFSEIQAQEILNLRLQRLTALEREKILMEYEELKKLIVFYKKILSEEKTLKEEIKKELLEIKEEFGDKRKTRILEKDEEDTLDEEKKPFVPCLFLVSEENYVRKLSRDAFSSQKRGGKGVLSFSSGEKLRTGLEVNAYGGVLLFSKEGKVYPLSLSEINDSSRTSKGIHIKNLIPGFSGEIAFVLPYDLSSWDYLFLVTEKGILKKLPVDEISNLRKSGISVIKVRDKDSLKSGVLGRKGDTLLILTEMGLSLHFEEGGINPLKRQAEGVIGIKLGEADKVLEIFNTKSERNTKSEGYLFTLTLRGFGKKTELKEFKLQGRGGKGILAHKVDRKTGKLTGGAVLSGGEDLLIFESTGKVIRISEKEIPSQGRATKGVRVISVLPGEETTGVIKITRN